LLAADGSMAMMKAFGLQGRELPARFTQPLAQIPQINIGFTTNRLVPAFADANSGQYYALPAEPSLIEKMVRAADEAFSDAANDLVDAAREFIDIADPYESYKATYGGKGKRRSLIQEELERGTVNGGNGDGNEEEEQAQTLVLIRPSMLISEGETLLSIAEE